MGQEGPDRWREWGKGCSVHLESWQGMGCLSDSQWKHKKSHRIRAQAVRRRGLIEVKFSPEGQSLGHRIRGGGEMPPLDKVSRSGEA